MEQRNFQFVDRTGSTYQAPRLNPAVLVKKQYLEEEIERLASLPAPANGRRVSAIANPASGVGDGLAPGIGVSVCVLKPGEKTTLLRDNSFLVNFCIRGGGYAKIDDARISFLQYDTWTTPPWSPYSVGNDTDELQAILSYSNAPLLEKLAVRVVEEGTKVEASEDEEKHSNVKGSPYGTFKLNETGAYLMPYEQLINPEHIEVKPLHWPWAKVKNELDRLRDLGKEYVGRRLYLLYDPTTGRTNGTTFSFFAAITIRPANIVDRPHRHISAAINYFFKGSGYSSVGGKRYEWSAGDLMLSAPGWVVHNHASNDEDVYEITIQDQPMHLALGSLLWQEDLRHVPRLLGVGAGFATNRSGVGR